MQKTISFYLILLLCSILGQAFAVFFVKIPSVKKRHEAANLPFSYPQYFRNDMVGILTSFIPVFIWLLIIEEAITLYGGVQYYLRFFSTFVGFGGGWLLLQAFGTAGKKATQILSIKANVSDTLTGGTSTVAETIAKAQEAMPGTDVTTVPKVTPTTP